MPGPHFDCCRLVPATPLAESAVRTAGPAPRRKEDEVALGGDAKSERRLQPLTQSVALHAWRRCFVKRTKGASSGENALHLCIACGDSRRAVATKVRSGVGQG